MDNDILSFVNPDTFWSYVGAFSVKLSIFADLSKVPSSAQVSGRMVYIPNGEIKQSVGGIQFMAEGEPFSWSYDNIISIRDGEGRLLWINYDYRPNKNGIYGMLAIYEVVRKFLPPLLSAPVSGIFRCLGCVDCTKLFNAGEKLVSDHCHKAQGWYWLAADHQKCGSASPLVVYIGGERFITQSDDVPDVGQTMNIVDDAGKNIGAFRVFASDFEGEGDKLTIAIGVKKIGDLQPDLPVYVLFSE